MNDPHRIEPRCVRRLRRRRATEPARVARACRGRPGPGAPGGRGVCAPRGRGGPDGGVAAGAGPRCRGPVLAGRGRALRPDRGHRLPRARGAQLRIGQRHPAGRAASDGFDVRAGRHARRVAVQRGRVPPRAAGDLRRQPGQPQWRLGPPGGRAPPGDRCRRAGQGPGETRFLLRFRALPQRGGPEVRQRRVLRRGRQLLDREHLADLVERRPAEPAVLPRHRTRRHRAGHAADRARGHRRTARPGLRHRRPVRVGRVRDAARYRAVPSVDRAGGPRHRSGDPVGRHRPGPPRLLVLGAPVRRGLELRQREPGPETQRRPRRPARDPGPGRGRTTPRAPPRATRSPTPCPPGSP